jgi:hypothetical protein
MMVQPDQLTISRPAYRELYITTAARALRVWPHMHLYDTAILHVADNQDQLIAMRKKCSKVSVWPFTRISYTYLFLSLSYYILHILEQRASLVSIPTRFCWHQPTQWGTVAVVPL